MRVAIVLVLLAVVLDSQQAFSGIITTTASEDTTIAYGVNRDPNLVRGGSTNMVAQIFNDPNFKSFALMKFDLSSYAGGTVQGDATLRLNLNGNTRTFSRRLQVGELLNNWDEATATVNNTNIAAGYFTTLRVTPNGDRDFVVPHAVVQSWIDSPHQNFGLIVRMLDGPFYEWTNIASRESGNGPQLIFEGPAASPAVPEPGTFSALAGLSVLGLAFAGRRRKDVSVRRTRNSH